MSLTYRVWDWLWAGSRELTRKIFLAKETQKWGTVGDFSMKFDIVTKLHHCHPAGEALLHPPLSPLVNAPLKEPPTRMSPSCRSSRDKSLTGMGWRYTWKQLLSFRVTGRVRTKSSEKRNTCSLCSVTSKKKTNLTQNNLLLDIRGGLEGIKANSYRATLVTQLTMTQQSLTVVYERIPLLIVQIFQFVYIILAFRLSFSDVNVRQNLLDYSNLCN